MMGDCHRERERLVAIVLFSFASERLGWKNKLGKLVRCFMVIVFIIDISAKLLDCDVSQNVQVM